MRRTSALCMRYSEHTAFTASRSSCGSATLEVSDRPPLSFFLNVSPGSCLFSRMPKP